MLIFCRIAYSTVYRVPPAEPSKAAMSREAWSTIYRSLRCMQDGVYLADTSVS